jgi:hypothetical protein
VVENIQLAEATAVEPHRVIENANAHILQTVC